ncbi:MAG: methylated-DNA--[Bacteroidales bacterium]|nr:methylated-DNA--[protein]-cysteine S-methyltransferase [Bacteroidales bacterium]
MLAVWHYDSPLGGMTMTGDGEALLSLGFDAPSSISGQPCPDRVARMLPVFEETVRWLDCYFSGQAPDFTPTLLLQGTPFRKSVWKILLEIPFGATTSYGQIAARLTLPERSSVLSGSGKPASGRMSALAVGGAVGHNPIALIVPCHRVIGADGSLTGYTAGLDRKTWLLRHEGIIF